MHNHALPVENSRATLRGLASRQRSHKYRLTSCCPANPPHRFAWQTVKSEAALLLQLQLQMFIASSSCGKSAQQSLSAKCHLPQHVSKFDDSRTGQAVSAAAAAAANTRFQPQPETLRLTSLPGTQGAEATRSTAADVIARAGSSLVSQQCVNLFGDSAAQALRAHCAVAADPTSTFIGRCHQQMAFS